MIRGKIDNYDALQISSARLNSVWDTLSKSLRSENTVYKSKTGLGLASQIKRASVRVHVRDTHSKMDWSAGCARWRKSSKPIGGSPRSAQSRKKKRNARHTQMYSCDDAESLEGGRERDET